MEIQSVNYYSFRSREVAEVEAEGGAKAVEEGPKATVLEENVVSAKHLYFFFFYIRNFHYNTKVPSLLSHGMMECWCPRVVL